MRRGVIGAGRAAASLVALGVVAWGSAAAAQTEATVEIPTSLSALLGAGPQSGIEHGFSTASVEIHLDAASEGRSERHGTMTQRVMIRTLREGVHVIPLLPADVALRQASVDGHAAALTTTGDALCLIVVGAREVTFEAVIDVVLERVRAGWRGDLPALASPAAMLELHTPEVGWDVGVGGRRMQELGQGRYATPSAGGTVWPLTLEPPQPAVPCRVAVSDRTLVAVTPAAVSVHTALRLEVLSGRLETLIVETPPGAASVVVEATGAEVTRGEGRQTLRWLAAVEGATEVTLDFDLDHEGPSFPIPHVEVLDAERQVGIVAVQARGEVHVEPEALSAGAVAVEAEALPTELRRRLRGDERVLAWGWARSPLEGTLRRRALHREPVLAAVVTRLRLETVVTPEREAVTTARYDLTHDGRPFMALAMPEGARVWAALVDGRGVAPWRDEDGRLLVPLGEAHRGREPAREVEVVWLSLPEVSDAPGALTALEAPRTDLVVGATSWDVYVPATLLAYGFEGDLDPAGPSSSQAPPAARPTVRLEVPRQGERYPFRRTVATAERPTRLTFRTLRRDLAEGVAFALEASFLALLLCVAGHLWRVVTARTSPHRHGWFPVTVLVGVGFGLSLILLPLPTPPLLAPTAIAAGILTLAAIWSGVAWVGRLGRALLQEQFSVQDEETLEDEYDEYD